MVYNKEDTNMTARVNAILSRVLSEEIGRQEKWKNKDMDNGFNTTDRDEAVAELQQFMRDNDIEFRTDYYFDGLNS
jgi:hypothetical protein